MMKLGATVRRTNFAVALYGFTMVLAGGIAATPAEARHHSHHAAARAHFSRHAHHVHLGHRPRSLTSVNPRNFAAIVVDANSGQTLFARNENEIRHPASITKVMTLYLLFEQLEKGSLRLDSDVRVSAHAARQAPTKLGLRPGETISVEDAIKAVVTRSANDIAVAIAERIGGDEDTFAELMTRKAHALGMSRTHFANASGLPNDEQVTTAHDLALLGRAIQDRFPREYRYFSTHVFHYGGAAIANHNHLMDRLEGMDGIKTGYIRASGFNLLASVKRDGHFIVAAVLGGASAASRDRLMAGLIEDNIESGATVRTAAAISEGNSGEAVATLEAPRPAPTHQELEVKNASANLDQKPSPRASATVAPANLTASADPFRVASIDPTIPFQRPRPAFVSGAAKTQAEDMRGAEKETGSRAAAPDGSTSHSGHGAAAASATPSPTHTASAAPARERSAEKTASLSTAESHRPAAAHSGWMIQIGATDDIAKATALLARAKSEGAKALNSALPFTEKVQKGSETLYRARFAGLQADSAELACKTLKRSGFSCFATKN
ncbi:D-alanyl-D-alanine carboxypeptidase [Methylocapsa acidiphila]|uniref:D-alanyl-D-alanine carboxypeptidase n=1 Tax=Methylocapsa acidiphila TaxID=133552 RepID=UPI00040A6D03|nr:D-alanyl-D-alanine carboxypeptidase [Methylocapsa acidiphila]